MSERILIIEDDAGVARLARDYLVKNGYRVLIAVDGPAGLAMARAERPDLVLLDLMLPGLNGRDLCRLLRAESDVPIIMITAMAEESDQVAGLELGADDYITKPFSPAIMVARVRSTLRRVQGGNRRPATLTSGSLHINFERRAVVLGEEPVHLTPSEYRLLAALAANAGQTLTRDQLMDELYGVVAVAPGTDRSVDSHVKNLRRKLAAATAEYDFIETVYGIGYRFREPDQNATS